MRSCSVYTFRRCFGRVSRLGAWLFLLCALPGLPGSALATPDVSAIPARARPAPVQAFVPESNTLSLPQEQELTRELAEATARRMEFTAALAPQLMAAGFADAPSRAAWQYRSRNIAGALWKLRAVPELFEREKAKVLDSRTPAPQREQALLLFVSRAERLAERIRNAVEGKPVSRTYTKDQTQSLGLRTQQALARDAALQPYFLFALEHQAALRPLGYAINDAAMAALWQARANPVQKVFILSALQDTTLPMTKRTELAVLAVTDIAAAKTLYERADLVLNRERIYNDKPAWYMRDELIYAPLAVLVPESVAALEKPGLVPLAATPVSGPAPILTRRALPELFPPSLQAVLRAFFEKGDVPMPEFPYLKEGETLFLLQSGRAKGIPVFQNTPLRDLAAVGPKLLAYTPESKEEFFRFFTNDRYARDAYLLAASATPQELAAHLAGIAVVHSAPERSLYGPVDAYAVTLRGGGADQAGELQKTVLQAARFGSRIAAWSHPASINRTSGDAIGQTLPRFSGRETDEFLPDYLDSLAPMLRIARVESTNFFSFLAPLADETGLARLMGPIRGVWYFTGYYREGSWNELRYAPARPAVASAPYGALPSLSLTSAQVKGLNQAERHYALLTNFAPAWTHFACGEQNLAAESPECEALEAKVRKTVAALSEELAGYGIKSPSEQHEAAIILLPLQNNNELSAATRALLKDNAKSPHDRIAAARELTRPEITRMNEELLRRQKERMKKEREARDAKRGAVQKKMETEP